MKILLVLVTFFILLPTQAFPQTGPLGVAISQAPEAAIGMCFGKNFAETAVCAQDDCIAQTGYDAIDCPVTTWCSPAGWTIDVFIQQTDGLHWHEFSCGWATREQAERAAKILCQPDWVTICDPVKIWSPDGEGIEIP